MDPQDLLSKGEFSFRRSHQEHSQSYSKKSKGSPPVATFHDYRDTPSQLGSCYKII